MKQNKNKNITKITSGALVLLLASGCLIGNSKADETDKVVAEGRDIKIEGNTTEGTPANFDEIPDKTAEPTKENKDEKPAEPTKENSENEKKPAQPNQKEQNQPEVKNTNEEIENKKPTLEAEFETKLNELTKYFAKDAGFKDSFKKRAEEAHTKYSNLLNEAPTNDDLQAAIDNINSIIADENNNYEAKDTHEIVKDKEKIGTGNNSKPSENNTTTDGKTSDGSTIGSNPGQTGTKPSTETNSEIDKPKQPPVPGEKDNKKSVEIKDKIAGEINKFKALLKDGSWTEESLKLANAKIAELEKTLLKSDLTEKDLEDVKASLNDIQINVLKKTAPKAQRKATNNVVIRNNSNNVKTGVESLASVLVTLSSSSLALFASKKRK